MSNRKTIRRITKDDLLCLLNKTDFQILHEVNRTEFGFVMFLEKRRYAEEDNEFQILEIVVEILSRVCSIRKQSLRATLDRFLRMLKDDCQQFLFVDVPRLIHSCVAEKQNINLVLLMSNYINTLKTVLQKDFFPRDKILNEIFPALENYMNRLRERKLANLDKAEENFRYLRREVEMYEDPVSLQDEDDEDYASFRQLSIVPRSDDIVNFEVSNIPQNIVDGRYKSVDHFLSVHYRLMREDMLRAFRECVKMYISPNRQRNSESTKSNFYDSVSAEYPPEYTVSGIFYYIKVITSKEVDWSKKGLLIPGTLVFLTPDSFSTVVFATVQNNPKADYSKSKECRLKIKLEDDSYNDELLKGIRYTMIEPSAYFESYKHVLSAIKNFSEVTFPLSDIIAYLDYGDPEPEYLYEKQYCLHEMCNDVEEPNIECSCKVFNPLESNEWPTSNDLKLDEQQYNAFKIALTKKVAVIQGPPGTGKTYIGVKVIKSLLRNIPHKPIVICCLTNHALDQFLERMLEFTKKIIRLGSQSKMEKLEDHKIESMMYAIRQYHMGSVDERVQKSLDLVRKIASSVLSQKTENLPEPEYLELDKLSHLINNNLQLYALCQDKYLEDSALNDIIDSKYKKQLRTVSGSVRKTLSSGLLEWLVCSRSNDLYDKCCKMFYEFNKRKNITPSDVENIWTLSEKKRYELFYCWRKRCMNIIKKHLEEYTEEYKVLKRQSDFKKCDSVKVELLKGADIIGVTTTGACKYKELLQFAEPRIILIEEAAQVLESHVIASLSRSIQHLILIGDHEQLRPLPADNELSEKYNLKVSMFERLFVNGAPSATLVMQHRMKPCIAELLVPRPYNEYKSYENVYNYEEIRGVESSVFFFDHREFEDTNSSGTSSSNIFEAQMIVALAKYLIFCSYSKNQITILATYAAQSFLIHKCLVDERLDEIYVTTVDNFQGEENDIILLSFVRSNPSVIGFLKESNRVCVALSRARKGMFCFGNFKLFAEKNDLWNEIVEKLRAKNMIGETLPLKCYRHNIVRLVKSAKDIIDFLCSGCSKDCNFVLPCNHICSRKCHFEDSDHSRYLCKQPCERMIDETRVCPRLCFERCKRPKSSRVKLPCGHLSSKNNTKCLEEIPKRLPCNHLVTVPCHVDIEHYQCKASVIINLDCGHQKSIWCYQQKESMNMVCTEMQQQVGPCGHIIEVPCCMNLDENELFSLCNKACGILLDCGHPCIKSCCFCFDTGIHGFCTEKCELLLTCGHKCEGYCGSPCSPCKKQCFLSCGHETFCINDCLRPCVECPKPCERKCYHKKCSKSCSDICDVEPCMESCLQKLPCGHNCIGLCGDPCPILCRDCDADDLKNDDTRNNLYVELECEHVIEVNELNEHISICLESLEWPCCPECFSPVTRSVRYKEKLQKAKRICIESCDTSEENSKILYLVDSMFGKDFIVPAQFIPVHREIVRILKRENPRSDELMVLKNCVMLLKELVIISSKLGKCKCDGYIQGKFDTLMLWIYHHLTRASFQQLEEIKTAVTQLSDDINSSCRLRL